MVTKDDSFDFSPTPVKPFLPLAPVSMSFSKMQAAIVSSLFFLVHLCLARQFPDYVQFEGNSSGPVGGVSPGIREALDRADSSANASHTVRFSSPGNGDWDWTLQISDVSVPAISNSTPDAHVAFTTWHFARTDEKPTSSKRAQDSPICAYLMDINFPYNVSSRWDPDNSSCVSALGASCVSALSAVRITDNCDTHNKASFGFSDDACAGMLDGGPREYNGIGTQGYPFSAANITDGAWAYALTRPYKAGNQTAFQAASEQLRIMILTGPEGTEAVCNRVARTVEIGAEDGSDSGSGQGGGTASQNEAEDASSGGSTGSGQSSAMAYLPPTAGLLVSAVSCGLTAYWL